MTLATSSPLTEARFRAMGTDVQISIVGGDERLLERGAERIHELEARWSRFLVTSEVSVLNRNGGRPVVVSQDTFDLVSRSVTAWRATNGRFDFMRAALTHSLRHSQQNLTHAGAQLMARVRGHYEFVDHRLLQPGP